MKLKYLIIALLGLFSSISAKTQTYCTPSYTAGNFYISEVKFGTGSGINGWTNTSNARGASGYSDFTGNANFYSLLQLNTEYDIEITTNDGQGSRDFHVKVHFDWDGDKVFDDVLDLGVKNDPYIWTGKIKTPVTNPSVVTRMRVVMEWDSDNDAGPDATACDNDTYGEAEDYAIEICDGTLMSNNSTDVLAASTRPTKQSAVNQDIVGVNFKALGCADEIKVTGITFGEGLSSNISRDVNLASVFFTGETPAYSTAASLGSTNAISAVSTVNGFSQTVIEGDNWFWVAFNIKDDAQPYDIVDAEVLSITYDSSGVTKTLSVANGNPLGTRQILYKYCEPTPANASGFHINSVALGAVSNANNGAAASNRYGDYVISQNIYDLCVGNDYDLNLALVRTSERLYGNPQSLYAHIYFDWNQDGDFSDEQEHMLVGTAMHVNTLGLSETITMDDIVINPPSIAKNGFTVMRVAVSNTSKPDACVGTPSGETEDYLLRIRNVGVLSSNDGDILCAQDSVELIVSDTNDVYNYQIQSSANGVNWTALPGSSNQISYYTAFLDTTTFFRVISPEASCPSDSIRGRTLEISQVGLSPVKSDKSQICLNDTVTLSSSFEFPSQSFATFTDVPAISAGTVSNFPITVEGLDYSILSKVNLDSVCLDFGSSDAANASIYLAPPSGTQNILLSAGRGANAADTDFNTVCFTRHASNSLDQETGVLDGSYLPENSWDRFIGENPNGDWTFIIAQDGALGTAYVDRVMLHFGFNDSIYWSPNDSLFTDNPSDTIKVIPSNTGTYKAQLFNPYCNDIDSALIEVFSGAPIVVSIDSVLPKGDLCLGDDISFYSSLNENISNPPISWFINDVKVVGEQELAFTNNTLSDLDEIKVVFELTNACGNFFSADSTNVDLNPVLDPTVNISLDKTLPVCEGDQVNFTANANDFGPNPSFEWLVNGQSSQVGGTSYSSSSLVNGDVVEVVVNTDYACVSRSSESDQINFETISELDPGITLTSSATNDIQCLNKEITFAVDTSANNSGGYGTIQWYVDGIPVTVNSLSTATDTFSQGQHVVRVEYQVNSSCTKSSLVSDDVSFEVGADIVPSIEFTSSASQVCAGDSIFFEVSKIENGGDDPKIQWFKNSSAIPGATGMSYASNQFKNQDEINVRLESSIECISFEQAFAEEAALIKVSDRTPTEVNIASDAEGTPFCEGTQVKIEIDYSLGGGVKPVFEWFVNNQRVQKNALEYYLTDSLKSGDRVFARMFPNSVCATPELPVSDTLSFEVNPIPFVDYQAVQVGADVEFAPNRNDFVSYTWEFGTGETSIQTTPVYQYSDQGNYNSCLTVVDENGCSNKKCKVVQYTPVTGISDQRGTDSELVIYPNPSAGIINISGIQDLDLTRLSVLSISGKKVNVSAEMFTKSSNENKLDLRSLAKGVYLLQVQAADKISNFKITLH